MKKISMNFFAPSYFSNEISKAMSETTSKSQPFNAFTYPIGFVLQNLFSKGTTFEKELLNFFFYAASLLYLNVSPVTIIRCKITANLRPTAMAAFFNPCLRISFNPHAFKLLHDLQRVSKVTAHSVNRARTSLAPHFEMLPCRTVSPDEYCRGAIP